jgi:AcrR family transcriptional regulator
MNAIAPRTRYSSPLRTRQKDQTRLLILEGVARLLRQGDAAAITITDVARAAEVTERTIYRHYQSREELMRVYWPWQLERLVAQPKPAATRREALTRQVRDNFAVWAREERLARAAFTSGEGHRLGGRASDLESVGELIAEILPTLPPARARDAVAAIGAQASLANWIALRDAGLSAKQAADAAVRGIELVLAGARASL